MDEALTDAIEELKRVDHLIFVSLKYTRTVDVIRSVINRILECYNAIIEGIMKKLEEENKIYEIPVAPMLKVNIIKEHYPNEKLIEYLDFYLRLRQIYRADFERSTEFRRHVTMISTLPDGEVVNVEIDTVVEWYDKTKAFLHYIQDECPCIEHNSDADEE